RLWLESDRRKSPVLRVCAGAGWGKTRFLEEVQTLLETRGKNIISVQVRDGEEGSLLLQCARHALLLFKADREKKRSPDGALRTLQEAVKRSARAGRAALSAEDAQVLKREVVHSLLPLLRDDTFLFIDDLHLAEPLEQEAIKEIQRMLEAEPGP